MTIAIVLDATTINHLDLLPAQAAIEELLQTHSPAELEPNLQFTINYPLDPHDPREWSEVPEVRLWFLRLDAHYPWLPILLDSQELTRYTAMLVPHQFSKKEGIQYNPEALEIFVMQKVFVFSHWFKSQGMEGRSRIKAITLVLGYELEDGLFDLLS